jgi:hypothetical protein
MITVQLVVADTDPAEVRVDQLHRRHFPLRQCGGDVLDGGGGEVERSRTDALRAGEPWQRCQ